LAPDYILLIKIISDWRQVGGFIRGHREPNQIVIQIKGSIISWRNSFILHRNNHSMSIVKINEINIFIKFVAI